MEEFANLNAPETPDAAPANAPWRRPFLTTHAALAASTREFTRLVAEIVTGIEALALSDPAHAPKVRRSPYRVIVQVGPVAATLTWLRDRADSTVDGELLAVVWRGAIPGVGVHQFERPRKLAAATARAVWEGLYTPLAESEAAWRWSSDVADAEPASSVEVAARCVAELAREYAAATEPVQAVG